MCRFTTEHNNKKHKSLGQFVLFSCKGKTLSVKGGVTGIYVFVLIILGICIERGDICGGGNDFLAIGCLHTRSKCPLSVAMEDGIFNICFRSFLRMKQRYFSICYRHL